MRVTFLLPCRGFSGGVRVSVRMATELAHMGHDVQIFYRRGPLGSRSVLRNLYKKFILCAPRDWISQSQVKCTPLVKLTPKPLAKSDVVMSVGPVWAEEMMGLPDECGRKILNIHGLTLWNPDLRERAWSLNVPKVVASNYIREEMLKAGVKDVCAVVHNGIDTAEYFPDGNESDRTGVGTVYGSGVAKAPETVRSVFVKLHELRPSVPLLCFGSEPRRKTLIEPVRYRRLPTVAEARAIYSKCLVWFCGSRSEGFGMPLLEAMACGCVPVSTNCGGPRDFVRSSVNGIILEEGSPDRIATQILKTMDDKAKRVQLAKEAIRTARTLSWSSAASKMEAVLKRVLAGSSGS